ncbi:MAG: PD40 domain-containing protein [Anaerolineae bacterium]|nr:PD40 domain-containing protein [Anaerolineae bacterium]
MIRRLALAGLAVTLFLAGCSGIGNTQPAGRLAFEREENDNSDVYVMNPDGTGLTRLTDDPGWDGTPAWSPDGTQIAFASERLGSPVIMLMNADGSDQRPLTDATYASLMPAWSPDGQQIAFASTRSYEVPMEGGRQLVEAGFEIWVMNADGSNMRRVTGNYEDQSLYPSWSPDGKQLASQEITDEIRIMLQEPVEDAPATNVTASVDGRQWTPAWSPDGRQIVFMNQDLETGVANIWLLDVKSGQATHLSQADSNDGEPAWSPDGKEIVFSSDRDGTQSLYIMSADGQNVRRLTTDDASYSHPAWSGK